MTAFGFALAFFFVVYWAGPGANITGFTFIDFPMVGNAQSGGTQSFPSYVDVQPSDVSVL
jgi:hypothetical protein